MHASCSPGGIRRSAGTLAGDSYFVTGASGTGKTTAALLIADEVADGFSTIEFNDPSQFNAEALRNLYRQRDFRPIGKGWCNLFNEVHGFTPTQIRNLLGLLEGIPSWVTFVFTTRADAVETLFEDCDDTPAFLSRSHKLALSRRDLSMPFATRLQWIAQQEGLDGGASLDEYVKLLKRCGNNLRDAIYAVADGCMLGKVAA